ncbi:MAG TPA: AAA family ATPase [Candidatus Saccharimonadales bacterium]|nr:AAA family ATPase [Candidatus Saccharimonadales bacterium]
MSCETIERMYEQPPEPAVFLITGPSAAGKSTVAERLAQRFEQGVHIEGDSFRRHIVSGRADMTPEPSPEALTQLRLRYELGAMAADSYFKQGFTVVLEDVIAGEYLIEYSRLVKSRPLYVVCLLPSLTSIQTREEHRRTNGYDHFSVQQLHDLFANHTPRIGLWLDTSSHSVDETVDELVARTDEAKV